MVKSEEFKVAMGEKLKAKRVEKGITQMQLADMLGQDAEKNRGSIVRTWESGKSLPSIETLREISRIYGCLIDDLVP